MYAFNCISHLKLQRGENKKGFDSDISNHDSEAPKVKVADLFSLWTKSQSVHFFSYCGHLKASQQASPELNMINHSHCFLPKTSRIVSLCRQKNPSPNPKQYFIPFRWLTLFLFSFSFSLFFSFMVVIQ